MTVFHSKRNSVVGWSGLVCKQVASKDLARAEAKRMQQLYNCSVAVPKVILQLGNRILMQNIQSITLTDHIEALEGLPLCTDEATKLAHKLCSWLDSYYRAVDWQTSKKILDDVNCRNFLLNKQGELYGIDFEADCTGSREQNIGQLLAFISSYNPANTPLKACLCSAFLEAAVEQMSLSREEVEQCCLAELAAMQVRRQK